MFWKATNFVCVVVEAPVQVDVQGQGQVQFVC